LVSHIKGKAYIEVVCEEGGAVRIFERKREEVNEIRRK
jgi:hypothetical protein